VLVGRDVEVACGNAWGAQALIRKNNETKIEALWMFMIISFVVATIKSEKVHPHKAFFDIMSDKKSDTVSLKAQGKWMRFHRLGNGCGSVVELLT
jgi:hypothetical protein